MAYRFATRLPWTEASSTGTSLCNECHTCLKSRVTLNIFLYICLHPIRNKTEEHTLNRQITLVAWADGTQLLASPELKNTRSRDRLQFWMLDEIRNAPEVCNSLVKGRKERKTSGRERGA